MPAGRTPGPYCASNVPQQIEDGTMCRVPSPAPVPVGTLGDSGRSSFPENLGCLLEAYRLALPLAPAAVYKETGYQLGGLISGLLPGLLEMLAALGATTVAGAGIGAVVGFFAGGAGAIPGAAVGADLGFDVGMAILTWLGVGFLLKSIGTGLGELTALVSGASQRAWHAAQLPSGRRNTEIQHAANDLAKAVGVVVRLLLQGIVAYLLKNAAMASSRAALATGQAVRTAGSEVVAEQTVAELVGKLRASKLGDGFANWVQKNWRDLVKDPRFRPRAAEGGGAASAAQSSARTSARGGSTGPPAATRDSPLLPKKVGLEPGAVPGAPPKLDVTPPVQPPDPRFQIKPDDVDTFAQTPTFETLGEGTKIYRIVGQGSNPAGSYWSLDPPPATEAEWRAGSAVQNGWNGDGAYVVHEVGPDGLQVWKGPAGPQLSSVDGYYLPGGDTQLFVPPGQVDAGTLTPMPTPWNK